MVRAGHRSWSRRVPRQKQRSWTSESVMASRSGGRVRSSSRRRLDREVPEGPDRGAVSIREVPGPRKSRRRVAQRHPASSEIEALPRSRCPGRCGSRRRLVREVRGGGAAGGGVPVPPVSARCGRRLVARWPDCIFVSTRTLRQPAGTGRSQHISVDGQPGRLAQWAPRRAGRRRPIPKPAALFSLSAWDAGRDQRPCVAGNANPR